MWLQRQKIRTGEAITLIITEDIVNIGNGAGWHCTGTLKNNVPIHVVVSGFFTSSPQGDWLSAYIVNQHDELIDPQGIPPACVLVGRPIAHSPMTDIYY